MKKLGEYIDIKAAIITLLVIGFFLFIVARCSSIDSDSTVLKKTQEYIVGENFELVSSEKLKGSESGKKFIFRSLERNLNFEMVVTNESDIINQNLNVYRCTYYQEINKIYESQVLAAIGKYFKDSQYYIDKYVSTIIQGVDVDDTGFDIQIEISSKSDIDNYVNLVNELNEIYSAENQYNGIHGVYVYAIINGLDERISGVDIDGNTTDLREDITNKINSVLEENNITLE